MTTARLAQIELPDFGMPEAMPEIPVTVYRARVERLRARAEVRRYDRLVGYADRVPRAAAWAMRRPLFQALSLPSQPRDRSRPLATILGGEGIRRGSRVGGLGLGAGGTAAEGGGGGPPVG